jgi:arabinan endo-1,5-alpha-L-arabinosidase
VKSTYKMIVGRAKSIPGTYLDKEGNSLARGGGSILLQGDENWYGLGHNSTYTFNDKDYLVFHGYDAQDEGKPKLIIKTLAWDKDGWPFVDE